jgi:hypothetical protein
MEEWARGPLGKSAAFFSICVDSFECAKLFQRLFQFTKCVNGWIPRPSCMPDFGQLGCSGFIVLDGKGGCASRKTLSLLQYGPEAAFSSLEQVLARLLPVASAAAALPSSHGYQVGSTLLLDGLKGEPALNGRKVRVEGFITASGRFSVKLIGEERTLAVLPCCLAPLAGARSEAEEGGEAASAAAAALPPPPSSQPLSEIKKPELTGCTAIDAEHGECTAALNALLANPTSAAALSSALAVLSSHFEHEEGILRAHKFGEGGGGVAAFSAMDGHAKDHARILDIARAELSELLGGSSSGSSGGASGGGCSGGAMGGLCRAEASVALAQAFVSHAQHFDSLFEGKVPAEAE